MAYKRRIESVLPPSESADMRAMVSPGQLWANMTSSTEPEVNNVLQCHQRRTEPRSQTSYTENLVKFGHAVFRCEQTDRQTDKQTHVIAILRTPYYRG